jgi:hypothetical protein
MADIRSLFGNLTALNHKVTSPQTLNYNCIAWAAEDTYRRWWPSPNSHTFYWPSGIPRQETVEIFVRAFAKLGYTPCDSRELEDGYQKVALYVNASGVPTHMARQQESGKWTSKLGSLEDIAHDNLECLEGKEYGRAVLILKRQRKAR